MTIHREFRWAIGSGNLLYGNTHSTKSQAIFEHILDHRDYPKDGLTNVGNTAFFREKYKHLKAIKVYVEWED